MSTDIVEPPEIIYVDLIDNPQLGAIASRLHALGILPDRDPNCPDLGFGPRFCPDEPARRVDAAVWMARAFGLVPVTPRPE